MSNINRRVLLTPPGYHSKHWADLSSIEKAMKFRALGREQNTREGTPRRTCEICMNKIKPGLQWVFQKYASHLDCVEQGLKRMSKDQIEEFNQKTGLNISPPVASVKVESKVVKFRAPDVPKSADEVDLSIPGDGSLHAIETEISRLQTRLVILNRYRSVATSQKEEVNESQRNTSQTTELNQTATKTTDGIH